MIVGLAHMMGKQKLSMSGSQDPKCPGRLGKCGSRVGPTLSPAAFIVCKQEASFMT